MLPGYLNLSKRDLEERLRGLLELLKNCQMCPRNCQIDRIKGEQGFCQLGFLPKISSFNSHFGEEAPLVGRFGSGTIFFTSCNLSCIYCQNYEISQLRIGKEVSFQRLAQMMLALQQRGCHNINLVTPSCQVFQIVKALLVAIDFGLNIPIVYNTSSYDSVRVLKLLDGIVDIYMPDVKYSDDKIAQKYSQVSNYYQIMKQALKEMQRQVGDLTLNEGGIAQKGLLIRHLVLPNNLAGSKKIFQFLSKEISKNSFLNIMDQYRPCYKANSFFELSKRITKTEYQNAIQFAKKAGLRRIYGHH